MVAQQPLLSMSTTLNYTLGIFLKKMFQIINAFTIGQILMIKGFNMRILFVCWIQEYSKGQQRKRNVINFQSRCFNSVN